jgi:hypothetical protein
MTFQLQNTFRASQILPPDHGREFFLRAQTFLDPARPVDLWVSSGIAVVHREGDPDTSERWRYADLLLPIGPVWVGQPLGCSPIISLASIGNQGESMNAGWAVDEIQWTARGVAPGRSQIRVESRLAVRDTDGGLFRVAFHITAYGELVRPPQYP